GRRADLISPHIAGYSIQGKLNGTTQIHDAFRAHFGLDGGLEHGLKNGPGKKSGVDYPQPVAPVIDFAARGVPQGATVETALDAVVRHAYDITRDDADLRPLLGQPDFSTSFDGLRKRYRVRQEFAGFTVRGLPDHSPKKKEGLVEKILRLGFHVENEG
ncbi:MAG TPA: DUF3410 domain-containing protein, partial [Fibrobacteria bacterium]|nr:DUF3410 domain-containing protein [Fibrobacteria bacterium]